MAVERQTATLPPAQPSYILRGHVAQIHSVRFIRQNTRLLTGDAEGWVVYWKVETKRALAVWKAHDGAILATSEWGHDKIITHGRDNSLRIWQLRQGDETSLSTTLPAEQTSADQSKPWLLHSLPVNTLNFCAFSMCHKYTPGQTRQTNDRPKVDKPLPTAQPIGSVLIAVPARDDKKVEVYQFPEERLRFVVPGAQSKDTGMVMAVKLVHQHTTNNTLVLVGYEGGLTAAFKLPRTTDTPTIDVAELIYLSQPHSQPILSIDVSPDGKIYYTSSADAILAAHRIPDLASDDPDDHPITAIESVTEPAITTTQISPIQQDRTDSTQSLSSTSSDPPHSLPPTSDESITFSKKKLPSSTPNSTPKGGLSSLLSSSTPLSKPIPAPKHPPPISIQPPHKSIDTKHSGQQSLRVRSDGRLLVTGGWDTRIRVYSAKTLKEVAVLKWHKEGVYAVDFSKILSAEDLQGFTGENGDGDGEAGLVNKETGLGRLQRQREEAMQMKHWVVAGAKDGKVSLWEVF
ncbi:hypothetical protein NX059_000755 [Plenodomus lindquistii]|nr:hypothetical protein NX059_000755 [Plenodomus lindquistii]